MEGHHCLERKCSVTGASIHVLKQSYSTYVQMVILSIYDTRRPKHLHSPILWYQQHSSGLASRPLYMSRIEFGKLSKIQLKTLVQIKLGKSELNLIENFESNQVSKT